jgi:hypothetical protein
MGCTAPQKMRKYHPKCPGPQYLQGPAGTNPQTIALVCPWCRRVDRAMHFDPVRQQARAMRMQLRIPVTQRPRNENPAHAWSCDTRDFLVGLYLEALEQQPGGTVSFAFCVTGSLARRDAAPFSDIDCFVILKDPDPSTVEQMKNAGKLFKQKLEAVKYLDVALMVDPVGIDPVTICDGPRQIVNLLPTLPEQVEHSLLNAEVAFGNRELLTQLWGFLRNRPSMSQRDQGLSDLKTCFDGYKPWSSELKTNHKKLSVNPKNDLARPLPFTAPGQISEVYLKKNPAVPVMVRVHPYNTEIAHILTVQVDLKEDLARPLMFCLNGLAKYNGITVIGVQPQAKALKEAEVISSEVHMMIINCSERLERIRVTSHLASLSHDGDVVEFSKEADIPADLRFVIQGVNCLQHIAQRYHWIATAKPTSAHRNNPFLTKSPLNYHSKLLNPGFPSSAPFELPTGHLLRE